MKTLSTLKQSLIHTFTFLAIGIACIQTAKAQKVDTVKVITVQSGKTVIKLTRDDESYLVSQLTVKQIYRLRFYGYNLKNNDTADMIVAILKNRK